MPDTRGSADSLRGKVAIVTGASREIGAAMAEALAERGAAVLLAHYQEPELAEATVARIRAAGGTAVYDDSDCSSVSQNQAMVARAVSEFGRLDIFVANAGLTRWISFLEYTEAAWDTVMDLNLKGSYFGAQAAARQMVRQGTPGAIVFSSSVAGMQAIAYASAYGVSKAGLRHMARCLALELGPRRISVNTIAIGPILNARNLKDDPAYDAHWASVSPAGRAGRPEDVGRALVFLVQNSYITGAALTLDGGWTIHSPTPRIDFAETPQ